ncbi:RNA-guided endonuclease InsQ/TnpB family protein [Ktedonobacter racemifer]|uniref:Transposase, IS605 OrfB family n=1 Tax=Ktedonobacter racemifer DSM 44963 TaxID=485913 RepID=D6U6M7_KTERA|nr:RNA-guided endonuclease TnpB family protein [Ktedonobacter racemifer]EFH80638.1 transposase, IS605 OrfB family [Ktedonobacter racemifer DSM 44963]
MRQIITAKLKLITSPEQFEALGHTQLAYRDALNAVSQYAFEQSKTSSVTRLHKGMYAELRARYHLPSQLACSVERQVAATYKGLWTKLKKNAEHRRAKITKKRFKGLDQPPHYSSPTVQYTYERDYTFQRESRVSVSTLNGRISLPYQGYDKHIALIRQGARIGDAKLWYDQARKTFYLLVSLSIEVPEPRADHLQEVVGVDVGIRYLAVTSTSTGKASFHPGKRVRHQANHYARLRKRLQQKGTRGAKRRLRRIEQRERRLKLHANHTLAKQIVEQHPHTLLGLEDLTHIRERTRRRKRKRKKNGKGYEPVSVKARKANRVYSQWSFAQLHTLISYKAALAGSLAIKVDANDTSKACPMCGHTAKENRPRKGLLFVCQQCHYCLHADLVGARNITMRALLVRQDWNRTGCLSIIPDASDREAKAARLRRYAELRWSPEVTNKPPVRDLR